jgi:hypothetical protein
MPKAALRRIFAYVCYTEGCLPFLPHAMLVCKLWNAVAVDPTLWTHANLGTAIKEKARSEKKLEWILKNKFPQAVDVDVTGWKAVMSAPALKIIAANCPRVSGLGLSNCVKLNYEDIRIVPSLFPNLERIDLSLVSVRFFLYYERCISVPAWFTGRELFNYGTTLQVGSGLRNVYSNPNPSVSSSLHVPGFAATGTIH